MDFINVHGNNLWQPEYACHRGQAGCAQLGKMVDIIRRFSTFKQHPKPILFSEDDGRCLHDGISEWPKYVGQPTRQAWPIAATVRTARACAG